MKRTKVNGLHNILEGIAEGIGFDNLVDVLLSVLVVRYWLVFLETLALSVLLTIFALNYVEFVETNVYAPEFSLRVYNVAIALNIIFGVLVARRIRKEDYDASKILRGIVQGVGQNAVLAVAFNMGKASDVYLWLPVTVWTLFTGLNFLKWLRNMALLGWVHGDLYDVLIKQFSDKYQIKLKDNEQDAKPDDTNNTA